MNHILWIALGASLLVVLAHVALFWIFLGRSGRKRDGSKKAERPDGEDGSA